jgi:hypothetical protein
MALGTRTVDTFLPRRRIGRSEITALAAVVLAWMVGGAAWLTEARSSSSKTAADVISFEDRFLPSSSPELFHVRPVLQPPLDRPALTANEARLLDAKGELAQQLASADWRASSLLPDDSRPANVSDVPLPRSRPAAADAPAPPVQAAPVQAADAGPMTRSDNRSMLQKLSDYLPGKLTLASLTPFQRGPDLAALGYDNQTAVYDISAHAVYLPSGLSLEAHSGLGGLRDDPDHVDQRMVGATPPATYDLRPREQLFHGVRALRMTPTEGSSTLGRAGLLVHSYMLGAEGDSNGCVSVRDYERFRKAFDDGEITRLVVVPNIGAVQAAQRATSQS